MRGTRRRFLQWTAAGAAAALASRRAGAQEPEARTTMTAPMDEGRYKPVRLAPKAGAKPSLTPDERDALEHRIHCQCGCTLDVFTCRTTDFTCQVSPAMHDDVAALVNGGYAAGEILAAFVSVYGERVLMAPVPTGFNRLGYAMPYLALGTGAVAVAWLLRRWGRAAAQPTPTGTAVTVDATPDELARIEAAVRDDRSRP